MNSCSAKPSILSKTVNPSNHLIKNSTATAPERIVEPGSSKKLPIDSNLISSENFDYLKPQFLYHSNAGQHHANHHFLNLFHPSDLFRQLVIRPYLHPFPFNELEKRL